MGWDKQTISKFNPYSSDWYDWFKKKKVDLLERIRRDLSRY